MCSSTVLSAWYIFLMETKTKEKSKKWSSKGPGKRGHIVADRNVSPFARVATFVADTKIVSDFVQKHFVSVTNISQFAQPKKHHGQQCVRNNVSSFTRALRIGVKTFMLTYFSI